MARKRENLERQSDAIPSVFTASSRLFKEWLEREVQKRSQMKHDADWQEKDKVEPGEEKHPSPHRRKKC
jgi:hypothetical protein